MHSLECLLANLSKRITTLAAMSNVSSFLIAIGGDGGLGKTVLALHLAALLEDSSVLHLDGFISDRRLRAAHGVYSGDEPRAIDFRAITTALHTLVVRHSVVSAPSYDHRSGRKSHGIVVRPAPYLILDGTCSLYEEILPFANYCIGLDAEDSIRYRLRQETDCHERGYSYAEFSKLWLLYKHIYAVFIRPSLTHTHCIVTVSESRRFLAREIETCHCGRQGERVIAR